MNISSLRLYTCRNDQKQIFCIDSQGSVLFEEGGRTERKEAGVITAAQIFFLILQYLKEQETVCREIVTESETAAGLSEDGIDGWYLEVTDGSKVQIRQGELKEITVGSTYLSAFIRQRIMIRNMMLFDGKRTGLSFR